MTVNGIDDVKPTRNSPTSPLLARRAVATACSGERQYLARIVEEKFAGFGADPALQALQQLRADFLFQGLDLLTERRLADMRSDCGAREMQLLGNCDKVTQMAQFHIINRL